MLARVLPGAGLAGAGAATIDRGGGSGSALPLLRSVPIARRHRNAGRISAVADKPAVDANISHRVSFSICHNVQEGETLTSIARQYNTPVQTIAAANKIDDIDFLQSGRLLLIPVQPQVFQKVAALVIEDPLSTFHENTSTVVPTQVSPPTFLRSFIKVASPLLLLIPVAVLCFRALLHEAQNRIRLEVARTQAEKELRDVQRRPRLHRWQRILDGDREESEDAVAADGQMLDGADAETEEQRQAREDEELRKSYEQLEATYMKFLSDSGLSRSGYWRGGIPSNSHQDG